MSISDIAIFLESAIAMLRKQAATRTIHGEPTPMGAELTRAATQVELVVKTLRNIDRIEETRS